MVKTIAVDEETHKQLSFLRDDGLTYRGLLIKMIKVYKIWQETEPVRNKCEA